MAETILRNILQEIIGKSKLTFLDFLIVGLGIALIGYQFFNRLCTFSTRHFRKKARKNPIFIIRTEVRLNYLSNLIELLPMLGLLGTVWGLRNALSVIANYPNPTIGQIAIELAPALSTTFFGLLFAVLNLTIYNYLDAFYSELCNSCRLELELNNEVALSDNDDNSIYQKQIEKKTIRSNKDDSIYQKQIEKQAIIDDEATIVDSKQIEKQADTANQKK